MTMSSQFMLGFSRAAAKSPLHSVAVIYRAEDQDGVIAYDAEGQMVFRQVQTTFGVRDLPSEDKLGLWLGEYSGEDASAGAVTLTVLTQALLDHSFLIRMKGVLYHVLEVKAGDAAGVSVKVLAKAVVPPMPVLLAPDDPWPVIPLPPVVGP